jgi:hypothetical protein
MAYKIKDKSAREVERATMQMETYRMNRKVNVKPKEIKSIWDNKGDTIDRYTIVFKRGEFFPTTEEFLPSLSLSDDPESPQGVSASGNAIEGKHLGKKIKWEQLPINIRQHILRRI